MTERDLRWRIAGMAILAGAGGLRLVHPGVAVATTGRATGFELALALTSFALACLGMLLTIQGARLRDGWADACARADRRRATGGADGAAPERTAAQGDPAPLQPAGPGGRMALTTFLILRARQKADRPRRPMPPMRHAHARTNHQLQRERR